MDALLNLLIVFVLAIIAIVVLGMVAGFSPTLHIAQAAAATKPKDARRYSYALMGGVLVAAILLLSLFQVFNLTTLLKFIDTTINALFVSVFFNVIVGGLFIFAGARYVRSRDTDQAYSATSKPSSKITGSSALFGLGFVKTILSVSGVTAIFIAGNIIASASHSFVENIIFTAVFLVASITPFVLVLVLMQRHPEKIEAIVATVKRRLRRMNYRVTVGMAAVLFGSAIIIYNVMIGLFY